MKTPKSLTMCALMLSLAGAGCETQPKEIPTTNLKPFKPIGWSCQDTKETRQQVIAHNSVLATLKSGKKTVYSDDCPEPKQPPKTS